MTDEALLTVKEVAEYLKLHPRTVSNKAKSGELPARRIGGQWRFDPQVVRAYNKNNAPELDKDEITLARFPLPTTFV